MTDDIPNNLGKYEIVGEIGRGSMGVVYQGYDPFIGRPVAVKVALADVINDADNGPRYRKMFFNEAHTAGMLRHPNILDVFDAGIDGDRCYIVMELVQGGDTLKAYCRPENRLPVAEAIEIIFKCAKALDYAHRHGVIHRDIKPSNILLTETREVKIADFSIAHITRADLAETMPMGFVGSPRYMSPEQIQEEVLTSQTDIFSLGIVSYELLSGRHPFGTGSFSNLIHKVINDDPLPLREFRPELPAIIEAIVNRALEKDPARRYRMGLDMATDLSAAFSHLERPQEDISVKEKFQLARKLDFFRDFPDSEIWEIVSAGVWQQADADATIIRAGELEDWFDILAAGTVRVVKDGDRIGTLDAGDCFGEMGYLNQCKRSATVIADGPVTLLKINATLMEQVTQECKLRFATVFLRIVCDRLAQTTARLARSRGP